MSQSEVECAKLLLEEHFGSIVARTGWVLLTNGPSTVRMICMFGAQSIGNVKASLRVLLQHQLAQFTMNARNQIEYSIQVERVLCIERYGRYVQIAHEINQSFGAILIEQLLLAGQVTAKDLLQKVVDHRLSNEPKITSNEIYSTPRSALEVFKRLVQCFYISTARINSDSSYVGVHVPDIDLQSIDCRPFNERTGALLSTKSGEPPTKRVKIEPKEKETSSSIVLCYRINTTRFDRYICEKFTIKAVRTHYEDEKAAKLAEIMFKLNQSKMQHVSRTTFIAAFEIVDEAIRSKTFDSELEVQNYLKLFAADNKYISCCEHTGDGGKFIVDTDYALDEMIKNLIAATITEIYGPKSARLFRLLCIKKFLQQKQLGEDAMLSAKEAKERSYTLFRDGYLKLLQYCKTPDYAPLKTCFVFTVDLKEIVSMLVIRAHHALRSLMSRRSHELYQNSALLEKKKLIDAIIASMGDQEQAEEQIEELHQSFTTHEKEQLEKLNKITDRTRTAQCQVDETLLLLQSWLLVKNESALSLVPEKSR